MREVLLGADPPIKMTRRAADRLIAERESWTDAIHPGGSVVRRHRSGDLRWWTWGGWRTNATLAASISGLADPMQRFDDLSVRLREDITPAIWRDGVKDIAEHLCLPAVSEKAMQGLKFSAALPARLAEATLAARSVDLAGATAILAEPVRFVSEL